MSNTVNPGVNYLPMPTQCSRRAEVWSSDTGSEAYHVTLGNSCHLTSLSQFLYHGNLKYSSPRVRAAVTEQGLMLTEYSLAHRIHDNEHKQGHSSLKTLQGFEHQASSKREAYDCDSLFKAKLVGPHKTHWAQWHCLRHLKWQTEQITPFGLHEFS